VSENFTFVDPGDGPAPHLRFKLLKDKKKNFLACRSLLSRQGAKHAPSQQSATTPTGVYAMKSMKKSLLGAAVYAALGFAATAQASAVIDLFADPVGGSQAVQSTTVNVTNSNQTGPHPLASVLGGYRDMSIQKTADPFTGLGVASMVVANGFLSYTNGSGVSSVGVITWDGVNLAGALGVDRNRFGLGGIDLTSGGAATSFFSNIFRADLGFNYQITVWDMDGDRSTLSAGVQFPITTGSVEVSYLFNWFSFANGRYCNGAAYSPPPPTCNPATELDFTINRTGGLIDFTRIGALQLRLEGASADVDLTIGALRTVPEPGALALVGIALLGAGVATRRVRAAKA